MLDLSHWTVTCPGMRVIVRREHPHPGATLDAFEIRDGYRYQAFTINTPGGQLPFLDARHRAHARVEDRIRTGKDTGIGHLPSRHSHVNEVWVELALIAADLHAPAQTMLLTDRATCTGPNPRRCATGCSTSPPGLRRASARSSCAWPSTGPGPSRWQKRSPAYRRSRSRPDSQHHRTPTPTPITETPDPAPAQRHAHQQNPRRP